MNASAVLEFQSNILCKAIENKNSYKQVLLREFRNAETEMLTELARRKGIKVTYYFGRLNLKQIINGLLDDFTGSVVKSHSIAYFVIAYDGGEQISDLDIIESEPFHFEVPDGAKMIGCYDSEERAEKMMLDYEG